ncbi:MAG: DUF523 domain-containing protein [Spirochaetia bacterium]|nr:DUF523 domain-containing protein [Spirochaetia bacterium]
MKILISRCLLGIACRYDGKGAADTAVCRFMEEIGQDSFVSVCPETAAGLAIPRSPAELCDGRVIDKNGRDMTSDFELGARLALECAEKNSCNCALLKSRSPSCGNGTVYDGTFSGTLIRADGITASLLKAHGIAVFSELQLDGLRKYLNAGH